MNFFSWIREKLNPAQPHIHRGEPIASPSNNMHYRAAYNEIEIVHRAVDMIVSGCVEVPFDVSGGYGPIKKLDNLLNRRPNPFEDRVKLFRRAYFDFILDGNAFFYYDGSHLYVLPANDVEIVTDPKTFVKGYTYLVGTSSPFGLTGRSSKQETVHFSPDEIIHIKEDNDDSIFRGKSRLNSLDNILNLYNALLKFQRQFFKNNAVPGIVLTSEAALSSKMKERTLNQWRANYNTIFEGARSPAILDGGLKIDKFSEVNFQQLDFENSIERLEQDMAKALGVPYVLMKSGNNANIAANQVLFYEHTVLPILNMFASAFIQYFNSISVTPDKTVITALQPDLKTQSQYFVSLTNAGIITADEARIKLGFEPLNTEDTSKIRVPQNIAGSAVNPDKGGRPPEQDKENADEEPET